MQAEHERAISAGAFQLRGVRGLGYVGDRPRFRVESKLIGASGSGWDDHGVSRSHLSSGDDSRFIHIPPQHHRRGFDAPSRVAVAFNVRCPACEPTPETTIGQRHQLVRVWRHRVRQHRPIRPVVVVEIGSPRDVNLRRATVQAMKPHTDVRFGTGRRTCVGQ